MPERTKSIKGELAEASDLCCICHVAPGIPIHSAEEDAKAPNATGDVIAKAAAEASIRAAGGTIPGDHLVCAECVQSLQKVKCGPVTCPLCRAETKYVGTAPRPKNTIIIIGFTMPEEFSDEELFRAAPDPRFMEELAKRLVGVE